MKYLIQLYIVFSCVSVFGQVSEFDFSTYKVPDYKYQSMDFSFDFNGNNSNYFVIVNDPNHFNGNDKHQFKADLFYYFDKNSRKNQSEIRAGISVKPDYSKYRVYPSGSEQKWRFSSSSNMFFDYTSRNYFKKNSFFEYGILNSSNYYYQEKGDYIKKQTRFRTLVKIDMLLGHGRVENITKAWKSYRIYKDLSQQGLLSDMTVSEEEISNLADELVKMSSERYFDFRDKSKKDIKDLFNYLKPTINNDIDGILSINDMFYYGTRYQRYSGKRLSYGFIPSLEYDNFPIGSHNSLYRLVATVKYENFHPVNDKWQRDFKLGIEMSKNIGAALNSYFIDPYMYFGVGYYPTTRTAVRSNINLRSRNVFAGGESSSNLDFGWNTNLYYYISPRFRFDLVFDIRNYPLFSLNREWTYSYRAGVNYAIF